jgi:hypothetical protein
MEVQETILAEELECTLYPIDGRDLSVELARPMHTWIGSMVSMLSRLRNYHNGS